MLTRFRMDVLCASVSEAVSHAGGLICDRSLTGWDVAVYAADDNADHDLALRILGAARAGALSPAPAADRLLRAVILSDSLYRADGDIRRWAEEAMREPSIEVLVWDAERPHGRRVELPISRAAGVFLGEARKAADLEAAAITSELYCQLRTGRMQRAAQRQSILPTANGG